MAVETVPETSEANCEMTDINPAALDAAVLAYLASLPKVEDEYVLVPREPTEAMIEAGSL